jgi:hypothetical protein
VVDSDPFSNNNPQYCREQLQHMDPMAGTSRMARGSKSNQVWWVDRYVGSNRYLVSGATNAGYSFSCRTPADCPK